jgi:hypothetical protein
MQEIIKLVTEKLGISADKAVPAIKGVLGYLRGQLPEGATAAFDKAIGGAANADTQVSNLADVAEKTDLSTTQVAGVGGAVLEWLKDKLPGNVFDSIGGLFEGGGIGGFVKKLVSKVTG